MSKICIIKRLKSPKQATQERSVNPAFFVETISENSNKMLKFVEMKEIYKEVAMDELGFPGAMISGSKSGYVRSHPGHLVVFNSNVCVNDGKIWFGDLDVTLSQEKLQRLCESLDEKVYVLFEMDARFERENNPSLEKAVVTFDPIDGMKIREDIEEAMLLFRSNMN